jgi:type I restriction enzyme M protein
VGFVAQDPRLFSGTLRDNVLLDRPAADPARLADVARLTGLDRLVARGLMKPETAAKLAEVFGKKLAYADVPGLCKSATLAEIEAQGWSLNPGRYVGVAPGEEVSDEDFRTQLEALNEELEGLKAEFDERPLLKPRKSVSVSAG